MLKTIISASSVSRGVRQVCCSTQLNGSAPEPRPSSLNASFKKGTGGRSSFSGVVCTVFGATGCLGPAVVNRLGRQGSQIIIPYRGDPIVTRDLKLAGDLGQVLFFPFNLKDEESIRRAVRYSNVVINLIGSNIETRNFSFYDVHVTGAETIARICREMGVEKLVHCSAMNASKTPRPVFIPGGSHFLRSKAMGEEAVLAQFPKATIMRPGTVFSVGDRFINNFMSATRRDLGPTIRLYRRGEDTFKMPVFHSDVAHGIVKATTDPTVEGEIVECVGPYNYRLGELVDFMFRFCHRGEDLCEYSRKHLGPVITWRTNWQELMSSIFRIWCRSNWEYIECVEATSDVLTGCLTLEEYLGTPLRTFEIDAQPILKAYDKMQGLWPGYGDFPDAPKPPRYPPIRMEDRQRAQIPGSRTFKPLGGQPSYEAGAFM